MNLIKKYYLLDCMGIKPWFERERSAFLLVQNAMVGATCFIILPNLNEVLIDEAEEILRKMLNVLSLSEDKYCVATLKKNIKESEIINELESKWQPKYILLMGSEFFSMIESLKVDKIIKKYKFVYHPLELLKEPKFKRVAYQELLLLKELINSEKS